MEFLFAQGAKTWGPNQRGGQTTSTWAHYNDVIMIAMSSQITSASIVYSTVCSGKETSKFRVTGLCEGNSPVTGEFPAQRASNAENVSIWWRQHADICVQSFAALSHVSDCMPVLNFRFSTSNVLRFMFLLGDIHAISTPFLVYDNYPLTKKWYVFVSNAIYFMGGLLAGPCVITIKSCNRNKITTFALQAWT